MNLTQLYSAFENSQLTAHGPLNEVVLKLKANSKLDRSSSPLVFSDSTGKQMDFDLSGSEKDVLQRIQVYLCPDEKPTTGPGRPRLGVVAREVSLLPRHWEWLATQSGGASATIRRLIEDAQANLTGKNQIKQAQERTYKVMHALAGDLPLYEEALRALYAQDKSKFKVHTSTWPRDIKDYLRKLSAPVFD